MTLNDWCKQVGYLPTTPTTEKGAVSICCRTDLPERSLLWELEDYIATSVGGAVVWLIPRDSNTTFSEAMETLLSYCWDKELKDYQESDAESRKHHIFHTMAMIHNYLYKENKKADDFLPNKD